MGVHKPTTHNLSRRDFLKLSASGLALLNPLVRALLFTTGGALLTACGNSNPNFEPYSADQDLAVATALPRVTLVEDGQRYKIEEGFDPDAIFLSLATRYSPKQFAFINNQDHRDILAAILRQNSKVSSGDFRALMNQAIRDGYACGLAGCVDSRVNYTNFFPNVLAPTHEVDLATAELVEARKADMFGQPIYKIGTQPAVFEQGINISVFGPHQTSLCDPSGCGAWNAIGDLVNDPNGAGLEKLKHHGVTQTTIDDLSALYREASARGLDLNDPEVQKNWAKIGAKMQAEVNVKQWGGNHFTAYGVYGHADDTFQTIGVVDAFGNEYAIDDFPKLKAVTSYLDKPHPVIEYIARGQQPIIIAANGSRNHTIPSLFGDLTQESGLLFGADVDKIPGAPLTADEIRKMLAGTDYGKNVLQSKNFVVLVADTPQDMAMLRNTLLTTGLEKGGLIEFFDKNGVFVEMIPDANGHFGEVGYIRSVEDLFPDSFRIDPTGRIVRTYGNVDTNKSYFLNQLKNRVERDYLLELIDDVQFSKITKVLDWLNTPGVRFAGKISLMALQAFGDAYSIIEFVRWFEEDLLGKTLIYKNKFDNAYKSPNARVLETAEETVIKQNNKNALVSLVSGQIEKIVIPQKELVDAFAGAVLAWFDKGPDNGPRAEAPWKDIKYEELSQILTLDLPSSLGPSMVPTQLFTNLEIMPYNQHFVDLGKVPGFRDQDPDQRMMLIDSETGIPILPDVPGQKTTISAVDRNNPGVKYFFELSVPDDKQLDFELRFVGLGCVPDTQVKKLEKWRLAQEKKRKPIAANNTIFDKNAGIRVQKNNVFAHRKNDRVELL